MVMLIFTTNAKAPKTTMAMRKEVARGEKGMRGILRNPGVSLLRQSQLR
jgi:hypothetical protein